MSQPCKTGRRSHHSRSPPGGATESIRHREQDTTVIGECMQPRTGAFTWSPASPPKRSRCAAHGMVTLQRWRPRVPGSPQRFSLSWIWPRDPWARTPTTTFSHSPNSTQRADQYARCSETQPTPFIRMGRFAKDQTQHQVEAGLNEMGEHHARNQH